MKKLFSPVPLSFDSLLLVLRLAFGGGMVYGHGIIKYGKLFQDPIKFYDFMGLGAEFTLYLAVFAELICAFCVIIGLGTRVLSIPVFCTMVVAVFLALEAKPFSERELAFCYMIVFGVLIYNGAGKYSVDTLIHNYLHKSSK